MSASPETAAILIVDDDAVVREIMRAELEDEGFEVLEAADGIEALELCRQAPPDLLVVDVVMPRMDGYELCEALRARQDTVFVPILVATGLDDETSISRAYVAGATDFIGKPVPAIVLRQRVRYMLRSARAFAELRANQAVLIAAKEAAEAGDRAKSEFLAVMSHELRTPLNAVIGFADLMHGQGFGPLAPQYLEFLAAILQSGRHLLGMIDDVLDIARADAGEFTLSPRPIAVESVIAEAAAAVREVGPKGEVALALTIEPSLPAIEADPVQLSRVLQRLLGNAVKFTPAGGEVSLAAFRDRTSGGVTIMIADSGVGMSADSLERAGAPFYQADSGLSRRYDGAGLGLPLARRVLGLHGADLEIDSEEGKGTTVTVRFPRQRLVARNAHAA